nr:methyltransferase domain-containing protein [uncultured Acetatifactor sp.]
MPEHPFWERTYADNDVSTFSKGPTVDIDEFYPFFPQNASVLDVGCGEGRNSVFMAGLGHQVDAFDISAAGVEKAVRIACSLSLSVNFFCCDLGEFIFEKKYDIILSHGVLHLPPKQVRDRFIAKMQKHTKPSGYNVIGVFTDRLPATPDNAPFTHSLFAVGELPLKYKDWEIVRHQEGTFTDTHPSGIHHEHAYERIIARRQ